MKYELKISLSMTKIIYSCLFICLLPLVRGISSVDQIGGAIDSNIALLAIIFCADTYYQEYIGKRNEVIALLPSKSKFQLFIRRLFIEISYLLCIGMIGYWLFFWQKPLISLSLPLGYEYILAVFAFLGSIIFWGSLSATLVNYFCNLWVGIGLNILLWLTVNSKMGADLPNWINIFAYGNRLIKNSSEGWIYGKITGILIAVILVMLNRKIINRKGIR